jgi:hypothetical protein
MKKFFCYERTVGMRWIPIFYTEKPEKQIEFKPNRSTIWEVPAEWSFDMAIAKHQPPVMESDDDNIQVP